MADLVRSMKRLWVGKGLDGLLRRRDEEAELIEKAKHAYGPDDYIVV
jgi:GH24 family phage-related lysozyme (muramidase)